MLVENYSNSRSLQTLSAAEAIFSGLRANQTQIFFGFFIFKDAAIDFGYVGMRFCGPVTVNTALIS